MKLKKELSLLTATLYGVGIILGAGIYVLIGQGAGIAGNSIWISFVIAAVIAAFTGLSYAELAGMFPKDAAEYVYTKRAFKKNWLSFTVEWIMIFTLTVSASTVALGFGGYFSSLFGIQPVIAAAGLIILLSLISYIGIKESARFNILSTLIEASGLIIIIAIGIFFIGRPDIDYFASPSGFTGILSATALIFFAYIGFEELVNLSEETKNASKVIPKALVLSLIISTALYIIVSLSAVSIIGADQLAQSKAPMTEILSKVAPDAAFIMSFIALFATANTVLVILIVVSRMLYGLSCNNSLPHMFRVLGRRRTPYFSIFIVMILSLGVFLLGNIKTIALLTDVGIFAVYIFINASLIWLRYKQPKMKRRFKSPIAIGKFPVLAGLGLISSILMLLHFDPILIVYEIIVAAIGLVFYKVFTDTRHLEKEMQYITLMKKRISHMSSRKHYEKLFKKKR